MPWNFKRGRYWNEYRGFFDLGRELEFESHCAVKWKDFCASNGEDWGAVAWRNAFLY